VQLRYWLVMPAAGASQRFRAPQPKQYAPLAGRTVIEWALAPFLDDPRCAGVVLALAPADTGWAQLAARRPELAAVSAVPGGAQRSLSVRRALAALAGRAQAADWVLVHDAARPCLAAEDLERLLVRLGGHALGGLLALPATDTLKRAQCGAGNAAASEIAQTVDRAGLWRALTPQMFRYGRLCTALDAAHGAGRFPTDEAQALEWLGEQPALIEGNSGNLKITTAEDLALAAAVLRSRHGQRAPPTP
jgi:2-C-methyl-D-erythritol 4-phosphate cytidylyltransferase